MGKVIDITDRLKAKRFEDELNKLAENMFIANLEEVWPEWETAFEEAFENEVLFGSDKALEILKSRCPFSLEAPASDEGKSDG